jgi:mRNA interferase MazF
MPAPRRGEVWLVDLGMIAKVRPCLVLSGPVGPQDRVLVTLVAHTTSARGSQYEVNVPARFLRASVFDAQSLVTVPQATLIRKLGDLAPDQLALVEDAVRRWLGL